MPYLSSLVAKSLLLNNHRSAGVDTDTASFSIYTGLYPPLNPIHFVSREDIALPTLFSELTPHYRSFLVTSSDAKAWFPRSLLLNTGLQELWDEKTLPLASRGLVFWRFKDETETAQYFIEKMKSAREPFIALYYPYATHAPYYDYEGASSPEKSNSPYNRYVRNLRLVDGLIERIIRAIDETGLANRTLVAITADHGEAFGEHTESFDHGFTLFEEAVRVPMLFYHPARILPRIVQRPTSHVDIPATILDILNRPYDASRFQGESALHAAARRYTFMYSPKSDLLGSVDRNNRKVIASGRNDECEVYDLNTDPGEKNPKACDAGDPQLQALAALRQMQTPALRVYQDSCAMTGQCGMRSTWPQHVEREHAGLSSGR
jgi:lipoteichoic acid synthase